LTSKESSRAFEVDPRIELISAVEALSRGGGEAEGSDYLAEIRSSFDSRHPACRMFAEMTAADWRHRHPSLIMFDFTDPPSLAIDAHHDHYRNEGKADAIARFLPLLRDFAERGRFMEFFARHGEFYASLAEPARRGFARKDYLPPVDAYLGLSRPHRYHFIMTPLYRGTSHHNVLYPRPSGVFDIYSINGHHGIVNGVPDFNLKIDEMTHTAWHEIAHTVVDEITQSHRAALLPLAPLYALMTGLAKNKYQGPAGWLHMVDEHVIRAITSRLAALHMSEAAGREALSLEKRDGFALVGPVYETLLEYEKDRARYPTIRDFYPRIVETLTRLYAGIGKKAGWRPGSGGGS
jgi:uncharacterized protein DUF4932